MIDIGSPAADGAGSSPMECPGCTNTSLGNGTAGPPYPLPVTLTLISLVGLLILFTVSGNVLVVIAVFTSRALRAPQNLFLVSLASADILVATLVIPFSLANEVMGFWYFGRVWCEIYLALDVLFCTSSIVHLCAISLDRFWSVTRAIEYNLKRTPRRIKGIIGTVWVISAVISFPPLITIEKGRGAPELPICKINDETWYIVSSSIGSFFAPCLIMVLVYTRIYQVAKRRTRGPPSRRSDGETNGERAEGNKEPDGGDMDDSSSSEHRADDPGRRKTKLSQIKPGEPGRGEEGSGSRWKGRQNRERRFTFVLAVVIGVFVICWFPFFFTYSLTALCGSCPVPDPLFKFFFWFGYCNSSANPLIYTAFNRDFRGAFRKILCRGGRTRIG